jgi:hypothetical protein
MSTLRLEARARWTKNRPSRTGLSRSRRDRGLRAGVLSGAALLSLVASAPAAGVSSAASHVVPVNTALPIVTGTPRRGQLLTAASGSWVPAARSFRYQWLRSRNRGRTWTRLKGATHSTYLLVKSDEGARISVRVTAISAQGRATVQSRATAPVRSSAPRNSSPPVISGPGQRGFPLITVTFGSWSGAGNRVSLWWQRSTKTGWQTISRTRRATYTPAKSDEGRRVRLLVTESNPDGSLAVPSNATTRVTPALPLNTIPPVIMGTPRPGAALSASPGDWAPPGSRFAYRWQRSADATTWSDIADARRRSQTVAEADAGTLFRVIVTATNPDGSRSATSAATGVPPVIKRAPGVPSGTLASSYPLTADGGSWNPAGATLSYSWERCPADATSITTSCTQVTTGPTYTLADADAGYRIAVRVSATAVGGTASADSPLSDPAGSALVSLGSVVRAVPHSFLGISTETDEFDQFVQKVPSFPALLMQLAVVGDNSPVSLRIGGESADGTYLNADGFSQPSGITSVGIDLPYLQRLGALARSVPLTVTLDLNLAAHNPQMAAALATEARKALPGGSLDALEVGNEPDLYHTLIGWNWNPANLTWGATYSPQTYASDFATYAAALSSATPGVPVAGPVLANMDPSWYQTLLQTDGSSVGLLTGHRYPFNACAFPGSAQYPTIAGQLSAQASSGLAASLLPAIAAAHQAGLKFRLTELGSASCTGLPGVSDTFATALWAPDVLFNMLADGVDGVNVHTRYNTSNTPLDGPGSTIVRPFFYGMVAFTRTLGPGASLLQTSVSGQLPAGLSVWPVALPGGQMHVLLINKAPSTATVALQAGAQASAQVQSLQSSSMSPGAQVTFGGQQLSNNGAWQGIPVTTTLNAREGAYQVSVPPLSASLLAFKAG